MKAWLLKISPAICFLLVLALPFAFRPKGSERTELEETIPKAPAEPLVIISPHWEGVRKEFGTGFSRWVWEKIGKVVRVEWLDVGGTSQIEKYIRSEFARSPGGINIDLFFGGGLDPHVRLAELGYLSPYRVPQQLLQKIPSHFAGMEVYDPHYSWYGAVLSGFGIIYNKAVLARMGLPEPKTWEDLAKPEFFTWIGSGDPRYSGSVHMCYEIMLQAYGWEKGFGVITRIGGNVRAFSRAGSDVPKETALGEVACGLAIDQYAWAQIADASEDRIGYVMPEGVSVINPDAISILKGSPHRELAELFIQYVLSEEGQRLWMLPPRVEGGPRYFQLNRMSIMPALYSRYRQQSAVKVNPFQWQSSFRYDSQKGSLRWVILNDLLGAAIIDTHPELVRAWKKVIRSGMRVDLLTQLLKPPFTEEHLLALTRDKWRDAEFRSLTKTQWVQWFREKYNRIVEGYQQSN